MISKNKYIVKRASGKSSVKKSDFFINGAPSKTKESATRRAFDVSQLNKDEMHSINRWKDWMLRQRNESVPINYDVNTKQKIYTAPYEPTKRLNFVRTFFKPEAQTNATIMNSYYNNGSDYYDMNEKIPNTYNPEEKSLIHLESLYGYKDKNKSFPAIKNNPLAEEKLARQNAFTQAYKKALAELNYKIRKKMVIEAQKNSWQKQANKEMYTYRNAPAEYESGAMYQNLFNYNVPDNRTWWNKITNSPTQNQKVIDQYKNFMNTPEAQSAQSSKWFTDEYGKRYEKMPDFEQLFDIEEKNRRYKRTD